MSALAGSVLKLQLRSATAHAIRAIFLLLVATVGCNSANRPERSPEDTPSVSTLEIDPHLIEIPDAPAAIETAVRLVEAQTAAQLDHTYQNGQRGRALLSETTGGGGGWLDYDKDGRPDIYLNQGGDATSPDLDVQPLDQLYRNLDGTKFENVTPGSRIVEPQYSQGVAIADMDNDGFDDIYVTNLGPNTFWRNCGDGTFVECSAATGLDDSRWSTSAAWADLDQDGDLDLYVCNYCVYDPLDPKECKDREGIDTFCNPRELDWWPDAVFFNLGDGTFRNEAKERGLSGEQNRALGVAVADFNNDGWPDVYVANDTTENFLFINQQDGRFVDEAALRGCAVDRAGATQGSMGLAVADFDQNGYLDIYSTHFFEESNTLYANFGEKGFRDVTAQVGLHKPTLPFLGFGTVFVDLDLDSFPELLVANGHVNNSITAPDPRMKPQLFGMTEQGGWVSIGEQTGEYFKRKLIGRGVATSDYDRDGDPDLLMVHENDPAVLLNNQSRSGNWLQLSFVGVESNRIGIGCRAKIAFGQAQQMQELCGGTSYAASHEPLLTFGLGTHEGPVEVEILWPSRVVQRLSAAPNQSLTVVESAVVVE